MDLGKQVGYVRGEEDKEECKFGREGNGMEGKAVLSLHADCVFSRLVGASLGYLKPHL